MLLLRRYKSLLLFPTDPPTPGTSVGIKEGPALISWLKRGQRVKKIPKTRRHICQYLMNDRGGNILGSSVQAAQTFRSTDLIAVNWSIGSDQISLCLDSRLTPTTRVRLDCRTNPRFGTVTATKACSSHDPIPCLRITPRNREEGPSKKKSHG